MVQTEIRSLLKHLLTQNKVDTTLLEKENLSQLDKSNLMLMALAQILPELIQSQELMVWLEESQQSFEQQLAAEVGKILSPEVSETVDSSLQEIEDLLTDSVYSLEKNRGVIRHLIKITECFDAFGNLPPLENLVKLSPPQNVGKIDKASWESLQRAIELHREQRVSDASLLLKQIKHDVKTPLSTMRLKADLIEIQARRAKDKGSHIDQRQYIKNLRSLRQILDILKIQLKEFFPEALLSDQEIETLTFVSFSRILRSVMNLVSSEADRKRIRFELRIPEIEMMLIIKEDHLFRIMQNVIGNAVKYTPEGGQVTVVAEMIGTNQRLIPEKKVKVTVRDTGEGLTPTDLAAIEAGIVFRNPKNQQLGNGIGLTIVSRLMKKYECDIRYTSQVGKGTVVTMLF